jgi:hypothetical protein
MSGRAISSDALMASQLFEGEDPSEFTSWLKLGMVASRDGIAVGATDLAARAGRRAYRSGGALSLVLPPKMDAVKRTSSSGGK